MKRNFVILGLIALGEVIYLLWLVQQLRIGEEHCLSILTLPILVLLALWKRTPEAGVFLVAAFLVQASAYALSAGMIFFEIILKWSYQWGIATFQVVFALLLIVSAIFILGQMAQKTLFTEKENKIKIWRLVIAVLLGMSMLFLPSIERPLWIHFDPRVLDNQVKVEKIYFSPDGQRLGVIAAGDKKIAANIWDVQKRTFTPINSSSGGAIGCLALSPNGRYVATGWGVLYA